MLDSENYITGISIESDYDSDKSCHLSECNQEEIKTLINYKCNVMSLSHTFLDYLIPSKAQEFYYFDV